MTSQALQTAGFVTGAVGTVGALAATVMDVWCTSHSEENNPTSNSHYRGLWKNCEVAESGLAECRSFNSHLSFTRILQAIRALMVLAIILGVIAVVIGCFSLNCIKVRSLNTKARSKLVLAAGILFIIAGVFDISGSSVYADQIVPSFTYRSPARSSPKPEEKGAILCQNGMAMGQIASQDKGKGTGPGFFQGQGQGQGQGIGMGSGMGSGTGNGMGNGMNTFMGTGMGADMGTGMGSDMGTGMGNDMGTGMGSDMGTGMGNDMGTGMGTGMGTEMGTGMSFDGTDSSTTRYTFGAALYIAWVAGVLLILAGIVHFISFKTTQPTGDTREAYIYTATSQNRGTEDENRLQRIRGEQQQQQQQI